MNRPLIFGCLFCLSLGHSVVQAGVVADMALWMENTFSGKSCEDLNMEDLKAISHTFKDPSCEPKITGVGQAEISANDIGEAALFNSLAKKRRERMSCEIAGAVFFEKKYPELVEKNAHEIFNKLPLIREHIRLANETRLELERMKGRNNSLTGRCNNQKGQEAVDCRADLEKQQIKVRDLSLNLTKYQALVSTAIAGFWNGTTDTIEKLAFDLALMNPPPSKEEVARDFSDAIPLVAEELKMKRAELDAQSTRRPSAQARYMNLGPITEFDKLSDRAKRELIETESLTELFVQARKERNEPMIKLLCRVEAKYIKGRDKVFATIDLGSLAFGGGLGFLSKVALAKRFSSAAQIATRTASARAVALRASIVAVDSSAFFAGYAANCLGNGLSKETKNACPTEGQPLIEAELDRIKQSNCALEAAIFAAPFALLAGSKTVSELLPKFGKAGAWVQQKGLRQMEAETHAVNESAFNPEVPANSRNVSDQKPRADARQNENANKLADIESRQRAKLNAERAVEKAKLEAELAENVARRNRPHTLGRTAEDIKALRKIGYLDSDLAKIDEQFKWDDLDFRKIPLRLGPEGRKVQGDIVTLQTIDLKGSKVDVRAYIQERHLDSQLNPRYLVYFEDPITKKIVKKDVPIGSIQAESPRIGSSEADKKADIWNEFDQKLHEANKSGQMDSWNTEDGRALAASLNEAKNIRIKNAIAAAKSKNSNPSAVQKGETSGPKVAVVKVPNYNVTEGPWTPDPEKMIEWTGSPTDALKKSQPAPTSSPSPWVTSKPDTLSSGGVGSPSSKFIHKVEVNQVYLFTVTDSRGSTARQVGEVTKVLSTKNGPPTYVVKLFDEIDNQYYYQRWDRAAFQRQNPSLASERDILTHRTRTNGIISPDEDEIWLGN